MLWKRLKNKEGYMFLESLIGLAMVTVALYVIVPGTIQSIQNLKKSEQQVELWRVAQDQMRIISRTGNPKATLTSNDVTYKIEWDQEGGTMTVQPDSNLWGVIVHVIGISEAD